MIKKLNWFFKLVMMAVISVILTAFSRKNKFSSSNTNTNLNENIYKFTNTTEGGSDDVKGEDVKVYSIERRGLSVRDLGTAIKVKSSRVVNKVTENISDLGLQVKGLLMAITTKWKLSENDLFHTFKPREGIKFKDTLGSNVKTAIFNFNQQKNGNSEGTQEKSLFPYEWEMFGKRFARVEATAKNEEFITSRYQPIQFLEKISIPLMKSVISIEGYRDKMNKDPIRIRYFQFYKWLRIKRILLEKYEQYGRSNALRLYNIQFTSLSNHSTRLNTLLIGENGLTNDADEIVMRPPRGDPKYQIFSKTLMNLKFIRLAATRGP